MKEGTQGGSFDWKMMGKQNLLTRYSVPLFPRPRSGGEAFARKLKARAGPGDLIPGDMNVGLPFCHERILSPTRKNLVVARDDGAHQNVHGA